MAQAFPNSRFYGFDVSEESLARAHADAQSKGVSDRVEFRKVSATELPTDVKFDFISSFDAIHDMVDPRGVLRSIRRGHPAGEAISKVGRRFGLRHRQAHAFISSAIAFEVRAQHEQRWSSKSSLVAWV